MRIQDLSASRNVCLKIYKKIRVLVKRYEFWILLALTVGIILGLLISPVFASESETKMLGQKYEQYVRARPATTTTTATTQPTIKPKVIIPSSEDVRQNIVSTGGWVAQCKTWMTQAGIPEEHWEAALYIIDRESDCNPTAQNPGSTAFGIGQFLNSTWAGVGCVKTADPVEQLRCMDKYVQRHGGWYGSYLFKKAKGWY